MLLVIVSDEHEVDSEYHGFPKGGQEIRESNRGMVI